MLNLMINIRNSTYTNTASTLQVEKSANNICVNSAIQWQIACVRVCARACVYVILSNYAATEIASLQWYFSYPVSKTTTTIKISFSYSLTITKTKLY